MYQLTFYNIFYSMLHPINLLGILSHVLSIHNKLGLYEANQSVISE